MRSVCVVMRTESIVVICVAVLRVAENVLSINRRRLNFVFGAFRANAWMRWMDKRYLIL
jgi:hypothetical protein